MNIKFGKTINDKLMFFDTQDEAIFAQKMIDTQAKYETEEDKAKLLNLAKNLLTLMNESKKIPADLRQDLSAAIRSRDWEALSLSCSDVNIRMICARAK
jgi:hypothetical protein